ncbi:hypothetical protein JKP88DRAFT_42356, partial [Tribonema minus]
MTKRARRPAASKDLEPIIVVKTPQPRGSNILLKKACVWCVKEKRRCGGGHPCEQCLIRDRGDECGYEQRRKSGPRARVVGPPVGKGRKRKAAAAPTPELLDADAAAPPVIDFARAVTPDLKPHNVAVVPADDSVACAKRLATAAAKGGAAQEGESCAVERQALALLEVERGFSSQSSEYDVNTEVARLYALSSMQQQSYTVVSNTAGAVDCGAGTVVDIKAIPCKYEPYSPGDDSNSGDSAGRLVEQFLLFGKEDAALVVHGIPVATDENSYAQQETGYQVPVYEMPDAAPFADFSNLCGASLTRQRSLASAVDKLDDGDRNDDDLDVSVDMSDESFYPALSPIGMSAGAKLAQR